MGDIVGFRGPYGNVFPIENWKGKNLVFIAGGIALPPLRSVIWNCLDLRDWFKDITIVYGARDRGRPGLQARTRRSGRSGRDMKLVVHRRSRRRDARIGPARWASCPTSWSKLDPARENTVAMVCGPPIMIKLTLPVLAKLGFTQERASTRPWKTG